MRGRDIMKKFTLKDVECTNCGSKATVSNNKMCFIGSYLMILGAIFCMTLIGIILGLPLIIAGLITGCIGMFKGKKFMHRCRTCKYKWETIEE